jgi:Icc-related predicted phosphoesterase
MRIIYLTDIHGDFERVKNLLSETVAQLYIISGDLIDIPFYNMETSIRYHELQSYFHGLRLRLGEEDKLLEDFIDQLLDSPDVNEEVEEKGSKYLQYTIRARRVMQQKYKLLKNIISMKKKSRVFCLPGNYDMDLKYTSLHDHDLHMHGYKLDDLRICGYGGAEVWTPGIPERYIVRYHAGMNTYGKRNGKKNEMYPFFRVVKPQIIVAHQLPTVCWTTPLQEAPSAPPCCGPTATTTRSCSASQDMPMTPGALPSTKVHFISTHPTSVR